MKTYDVHFNDEQDSFNQIEMNESIEAILHRHLIPFELKITELGIRGRIKFEEAMISAMKEYSEKEKQLLKDNLKNEFERL